MSSAELDLILEQALQLRATGVALEACLERFPDHAEALRPLLEAADLTAAGLDAAAPLPTPDLARGRARLIAAARSSRSRAPAAPWRWAVAALIAIGLVLTMGVASSRALPGDVLYPVKRGLEAVELALTTVATDRLQLEADFNARRRAELIELTRLRRVGVVEFEGYVESADGDSLVVDGLRLTGANGAATAGDRVLVRVRTGSGTLEIEALQSIRTVAPPAPTPTATPTTAIQPSATLRPTVTAQPTATARPPSTADRSVGTATREPETQPAMRAPTETSPAASPEPGRPTRDAEIVTAIGPTATREPRQTEPPVAPELSATPSRRRP